MRSWQKWWDKNALKVAIGGFVLAVAGGLYYTRSSAIVSLYNSIAMPWQRTPHSDPFLADAKVKELNDRIAELTSQNQQLKQLLSSTSSLQPQGTIAPITGRSPDSWWQEVIVGRGSRDGIKEGATVLGTGGLVGRITIVGDASSRVLLVSDPSSRVGISIVRSRHMGLLQGTILNRATIRFFDKNPDVKIGDVVATASTSQLFPAGIPIGRVVKIEREGHNNNPAPEAIVELTAPLNRLEWVTIHNFTPQPPPPTPTTPPSILPTPAASNPPTPPSRSPTPTVSKPPTPSPR
jgi:rod shape-determining protein MreC